MIIWDSKKLSGEEVLIGSFSVSSKFLLDGCGPLWLFSVYGPNNSLLRKDFCVELLDIFSLSFPLWCVGGDFNVIRRISKKLGVSSLTSSMRDIGGFRKDCELVDPPLQNTPFTWSNMQESPVCKKLDRFFYSNEIANIDAVEQEGVLSSELSAQRALRKGELEELILREEIYWRQKGRVKWVKEGDCNLKFFHKVANSRRNRKFIKFLKNERGLVLNNTESII